jgi:DNA-directed RNA polymerase sigma subunit (sigma70/sigma32)
LWWISPEDILVERQLGATLHYLLYTVLTPREFRVIAGRFGLIDGNRRTLAEIGEG